MAYQVFLDGQPFPHSLSKIVCIGRNYADHARELGNAVPEEPLLFIKPSTSVVPITPGFTLPTGLGRCHIETEMALLIGELISHAKSDGVLSKVAGVGIGLDLTLRELQNKLKRKGHPWEKSKAFDGSCPLSEFVSPTNINWDSQALRLTRNGRLQQVGNTSQMITPVAQLLAHISMYFSLSPGDVVLTGTPAGVGPLVPGDKLLTELEGFLKVETEVLSAEVAAD